MLKVNDKIKMVKTVGSPRLMGEVFNVESIENGVVNFNHPRLGKGSMSLDGYDEYFEIVEDVDDDMDYDMDYVLGEDEDEDYDYEDDEVVDNVIPLHKTSKWTKWIKCTSFSYKTDNQKRVIVKTNDGLKSKCSCNKGDTFSLKKGLDLCLARIETKRAEKKMFEKMNEYDMATERYFSSMTRLQDVLDTL